MTVGNNLELNVVRVFDEAFEVDIGAAETGLRLVAGSVKSAHKTGFVQRRAHPATTATGGGFDHDGVADLLGDAKGFGLGFDDPF